MCLESARPRASVSTLNLHRKGVEQAYSPVKSSDIRGYLPQKSGVPASWYLGARSFPSHHRSPVTLPSFAFFHQSTPLLPSTSVPRLSQSGVRRNAGRSLEAGPGSSSQGAGRLSPGSQSSREMLPVGARVERGAESGVDAPAAANAAPQAEVADGPEERRRRRQSRSRRG